MPGYDLASPIAVTNPLEISTKSKCGVLGVDGANVCTGNPTLPITMLFTSSFEGRCYGSTHEKGPLGVVRLATPTPCPDM